VAEGPQSEVVARLTWERREVLFQLWVLQAPSRGLAFAEAGQVVEALTAAQEAAR